MQAPGHNSGATNRRKSTRLSVYNFMHATATLSPPVSTEQPEQSQSAQHWTGLLADISPKGAQVILQHDCEKHFKENQNITVQIKTILENINFNVNAQIKSILPDQEHKDLCLRVQFTGLESNSRAVYEITKICRYIDRLQTETLTEHLPYSED